MFQATAGFSLLFLTFYVFVHKADARVRRWPFLLMTGTCGSWVCLDAMRFALQLRYGLDGPGNAVSSCAGMLVVGTGWSVLNFALRFPGPRIENARLRTVFRLSIPLLFSSFFAWHPEWTSDRRIEEGFPVSDPGWPLAITAGSAFSMIAAGTAILTIRYRRAASPAVRVYMLYSIAGVVLFTASAYSFALVLPFFGLGRLFFLGPSTAVIFALLLFWAIVTRRLYEIRAAFRRLLLAMMLLSCAAGGFYAVFRIGTAYEVEPTGFGVTLGFALLLMLGWVLYYSVLPAIYYRVYGRSYDVNDLINRVIHTTTVHALADFRQLVLRIGRDFQEELGLKHVTVAYHPGERRLTFVPRSAFAAGIRVRLRQMIPTSRKIISLVFRPEAPELFWVEDLTTTNRIVETRTRPRVRALVEEFRATLVEADIELYCPVVFRGKHLAYFFLGRKKNGEPFYHREVNRIASLSGILSVALQNNLVFGDLLRVQNNLHRENTTLVESSNLLAQNIISLEEGRNIIYRSAAMAAVIRTVENAAGNDETVLIQGESGTGKELAASLIHQKSARNGRPFVATNCGALAESLVESELFGHERGAFTGATGTHCGLFEQANGGTVFLDEIG
ncbi:MAG: sigma 54-interacting transcriptional regulator, partial [Leptospirales bacterium]